MKQIQIQITGDRVTGKSSLAYFIRSMLLTAGVECDVIDADEMIDKPLHRLANGLHNLQVVIETKTVRP
jgi:adenylylsulfate kinase-like enzyme